MDSFFAGKRALVTGAASGIGRGIAIELAKLGACVIALDISQNGLESLKQEISTIEIISVDITNWTATKEAVEQACPIDLLVNNAGVGIILPLEDVTEGQVNQFFDVNVKAIINITQTVTTDLLKRNARGSIVNMSSQASLAALPNHTLYCATKSAVDGFTRAVALDYGSKGIRINCVNPTVVMTDLGRRFWSNPTLGDPMKAKIPLNRFAEIDDVVDAVIFLLSDKSKMITGTCLPVDGGFLAC